MKNLLTAFILLLSWFNACSQEDTTSASSKTAKPAEKPVFWDKWMTGGNLGLSFGSETYVEVSPLLGYKLTERLVAGVGGTYIFYRNNYYDYSSSVYGGRLFGRYLIIENIFGHAEYEVLNFKSPLSPDPFLAESLFLGGGYRQQIGGRVYTSLLVLYNVLWEQFESPYPIPLVIRGGFTVGF